MTPLTYSGVVLPSITAVDVGVGGRAGNGAQVSTIRTQSDERIVSALSERLVLPSIANNRLVNHLAVHTP